MSTNFNKVGIVLTFLKFDRGAKNSILRSNYFYSTIANHLNVYVRNYNNKDILWEWILNEKPLVSKKDLCNRGYQYSLISSSLTTFSIVYYQTRTKNGENVRGWFGWKYGNTARNQVKLRAVKIGFQRLVGIETRVPTSSVLLCWDSCLFVAMFSIEKFGKVMEKYG